MIHYLNKRIVKGAIQSKRQIMNVIDELTQRNAAFATSPDFSENLKIMPKLKTVIIGCIDPRVDPTAIFGLKNGEAAIIRNIGGRVMPSALQTMGLVRSVAVAQGQEVGHGWNLIVLHHTDCGISGCHAHAPALLAKNLGVETVEELDNLAISDPYKSVAVDVAALKANPNLPGGFLVTGVVYDVKTGRVETVVPSALLRPEAV
jgi:carbonic anhydrase